jgi:hypothetical protein
MSAKGASPGAPEQPPGLTGEAPKFPGTFGSSALEQASLSVMHPEHPDPDWRYYFGAWAG